MAITSIILCLKVLLESIVVEVGEHVECYSCKENRQWDKKAARRNQQEQSKRMNKSTKFHLLTQPASRQFKCILAGMNTFKALPSVNLVCHACIMCIVLCIGTKQFYLNVKVESAASFITSSLMSCKPE